LGAVSYTYDGVNRQHSRFPDIPGSTAIPISVNQTGMTALHEIGHAASDNNNGGVLDLYNDLIFGFPVNKKARANAGDPIPIDFATYNGTNYLSDQTRNSIGYPNTWTSYHPELIDNTRPNLMDNYWFAIDPTQCRLDELTYDWYRDRLNAKLSR
jgi:hypothetical protein